jgi:hypothetical protein
VSEVSDVRAWWASWRSGEYSVAQWLRSYRQVVQYEVWAKDDPLPLMMLLPSAVAQGLRRLRRPAPAPSPELGAAHRRLPARQKASSG